MIRASRHTLITNIIQQACAAALLLFLPNILSKPDYAQVVFISVLLSFIGFADAGMSLAYGRVVPLLLTQNKHDEVKLWDSTTLRFGLFFSAIYSVVVACIYYERYGDITRTLLFLPMPLIVFWFSFHITRFSSAGNFHKYRTVNSWRSAASLLALPFVFAFGLTGFFISSLLAALAALVSVGRALFQPLGKPHWSLVKSYLPEAIVLSLTSVLWMMLMNVARFYASANYTAEDIATYGIISAIGTSMMSLLIAVFMPVGVEIRSRHGKGALESLFFMHDIIRRSLPWTIAITVISVICASPFLRICFPSYHFDNHIIAATVLGITVFTVLNMYGQLMIVRKKLTQYLLFAVASIVIGWVSAINLDHYYPSIGAAYGQLIGVMCYTIMLFFTLANFSDITQKMLWQKQIYYLFVLYGVCALVFIYVR